MTHFFSLGEQEYEDECRDLANQGEIQRLRDSSLEAHQKIAQARCLSLDAIANFDAGFWSACYLSLEMLRDLLKSD